MTWGGNDVPRPRNALGSARIWGNDGESDPTCCGPGVIYAATVTRTLSSQNLTAQNLCTIIDL